MTGFGRGSSVTAPGSSSGRTPGFEPGDSGSIPGPGTYFFAIPGTRWQRFKLRFTWPYIRQTRFICPIIEWWWNRV